MLLHQMYWNRACTRRLSVTCALLAALASNGCSSSGGTSAASAGAGGGAGSSAGGASARGGAQGTAGMGAPSAGTTSSAGTADADAGTVKLHETWSTWQLSGTTLTAITCPMLGANTIGFSYDGATLETQQNSYEGNGQDCAAGEDEITWPFGPGDFSLTYGIYPNTFDTQVPIVATSVPFTVTPTSTVIEVDGKMIFARYPITWTIQKGGAAATCADVGATGVNILLDQGSDGVSITTTFPTSCAPGAFTSPPITPGSYRLSAQLMANDSELAEWAAPAPLVITADNAPALPAISFTVP